MEGTKKQLPHIDFMAGIGMLMIVFTHSPQAIFGVNRRILDITGYGEMGCQIFFLLTGFKLCYSYYGKTISLGIYYLKRWLSIAPLYWLTILIGFLLNQIYSNPEFPQQLIGCYRQSTDIKALIANALLIHNVFLFSNNNVVGGGWYVGVTAIFYFIFPLLVSFFDFVHQRFGAMVMLLPFVWQAIMTFLKMWCIQSGCSLLINCEYFSFFEQSVCILFGMILYYQYVDGDFDRIKSCNDTPLLIALIFLVILNVFNYRLRYVNVQMLFTALWYVLFIYLYGVTKKESNFLYQRICKIGKVSYALFFVHVIVFYEVIPVLYRIMPMHLSADLFWIISVGISLYPMYCISKCCMKLNNKLKDCCMNKLE